jgi:hypothetical protein
MFCKNCGNLINDNVTFCANCGLRVKPAPDSEDDPYWRTLRDGIGSSRNPIFVDPIRVSHNQAQAAEDDDNYPPNDYANFTRSPDEASPAAAPAQTLFPEVITKEDTEQPAAEETSLAGQISGLTARREELEQQTGGDAANPAEHWVGAPSVPDYTFGIYGEEQLPVAQRGNPAEIEKVYFGKGALIFCLTMIGLLSVTCGIFAGLYFSVI